MTALLANVVALATTKHNLPAPEMRRALRIAAGLSQQQVANGLGVSRSAVDHWEKGRREPRAQHLAEYAYLLQQLQEILAA